MWSMIFYELAFTFNVMYVTSRVGLYIYGGPYYVMLWPLLLICLMSRNALDFTFICCMLRYMLPFTFNVVRGTLCVGFYF